MTRFYALFVVSLLTSLSPLSAQDTIPITDADLLAFGATNNTEDSGVLRYVSIRYAQDYGLALAGVGSGTTVDFVETVEGLNGYRNFRAERRRLPRTAN